MNRTLPLRIGFYTYATLLALLTLEVAAVSLLRYFTDVLARPEVVTDNAFANPYLVLHVAGGVTALLLGPLQFVARVRERMPQLHRASGRIYAVAIAIGAPAGLMLSLGTTAGPIAGAGFALMAILWPVLTALGIKAAIDGRFEDHRAWMIRSYALTAAALTLRLMLPFAGLVLAIPFTPAYRVIAWISWMTNLAIAEFYLRRKARLAIPSLQPATA
ncbi:MAG TPA: DUF2306 domain-containing protein [Sphingomicrobium sp.]|jgi:uncharacterized membrane protein